MRAAFLGARRAPSSQDFEKAFRFLEHTRAVTSQAAPALAVVQVAEPCSPHSPPEGTRTFPATRGVPS